MSTSIVHVMTVIGKGAEQVEAACEDLLGRRVPRHPKAYGTDDWAELDHDKLERLCSALVRASRRLPVYYYAQYLDSWSVASSMFGLVDWPDAKKRLICGSNHTLAFYPSRYAQEYLDQIEIRKDTDLYRTQSEDRWYLDQVKEAIASALWLKANFLVVAITEAIEGSRMDEEVNVSLEMPMDLGEKSDEKTA